MFQRAQQKQRHIDIVRAPAVQHMPAIAVGKQTLTQHETAGHLGAPDFYTRAVESAMREIDALRSNALPAYVAVRRKQDIAPLTKQIELARAAIVVRHMILTANAHVFALEQSATHVNPMVLWLRAKLDLVVERASKLGVYDGAHDMKPQRFIEDKPKQKGGSLKLSTKTDHKLAVTESSLTTGPAQVTRAARTRLARGTGPVTTPAKAAPGTGAPTDQRSNTAPRMRPGFRPSAGL